MNKVIPNGRTTRSHKSRYTKIKETRIVFFGSESDPAIQESRRRAEISGRATEVVARPPFDTGIGPCGKHVCSCKGICKNDYVKSIPFPQ